MLARASQYSPPFVILGLPRSRTAWVSRFLSYGGKRCGHDIADDCGSVAEFVAHFGLGSLAGTVETGAVVGWKALLKRMPKAKVVVLKRPVDQIIASLARLGFGSEETAKEVIERCAMLDAAAATPGIPTITFEELADRDRCAWLFEHCLGTPFDEDWWLSLRDQNIQIDIGERVQKLIANRDRIEALKAEAIVVGDGLDVIVAAASWDQVWPEADALGAEHFAEVDGDIEPNRPYKVDADLARQLYDLGFMRIYAARVDGALAGYCTWQVSRDVESAGLLIAQQGAWFVRKGYDRLGIGRKLFDASVAGLKALGVKNIFPHHRLQGRGAELGKFFASRGAKATQHTYSLWIGD